MTFPVFVKKCSYSLKTERFLKTLVKDGTPNL